MAGLINSFWYGGTSINDSFVMEITTIGASESFTFPFYNGGTYTNCTIDFGDGGGAKTISTYNDANATNIYATAATYTITISADACGGIKFNSAAPYDQRADDVTNWGTIPFSYIEFYGCQNMTVTATDVPDLSNITSAYRMFRDCDSIVTIPNLDSWDVSGILNMKEMFYQCLLFNQDINSWDTSSVTNMSYMFNTTGAFNGNIVGWDVSSVTDFSFMFKLAVAFNKAIGAWTMNTSAYNLNSMFANTTAFNQPLSGWITTPVTNFGLMFNNAAAFNQDLNSWDVSSGTYMSRMFSGGVFNNGGSTMNSWVTTNVTNMSIMFQNSPFNQDISSWNVTKVTEFNSFMQGVTEFNQDISGWTINSTGNVNMNSMLGACTSLNQNISLWNYSKVDDLTDFLNPTTGLSTANYDLLLLAWDSQTLVSGLSTDAGNTQYTETVGETGTTDGTTSGKLVDSTATFLTSGVLVNDVIYNETDETYAIVDAIDSNSTLSISVDIMVSGELYRVQTSAVAKAKASVVINDSWTISDGGGV